MLSSITHTQRTSHGLHPNGSLMALGMWLILGIAGSAWGGGAVDTRIHSIEPGITPSIRDGAMVYELNITFSNRPDVYWSYFDFRKEQLVVELHDTRLQWEDHQLPPGLPYRSPEFENTTSKKSITRSHAIIRFHLDQGWYHEIESQGQNVIRITFHKPLATSYRKKRKFPMSVIYVSLATVFAVGSFIMVMSLIE